MGGMGSFFFLSSCLGMLLDMICVPPARALLDFWNLTVSISHFSAAVIEYPTKATLERRGIMSAHRSRGLGTSSGGRLATGRGDRWLETDSPRFIHTGSREREKIV